MNLSKSTVSLGELVVEDAFGNTIGLNDKIIYSTGALPALGTQYHIGEVVKLYPFDTTHTNTRNYTPPDRVKLNIIASTSSIKPNNPIVYASNVILIKALATHIERFESTVPTSKGDQLEVHQDTSRKNRRTSNRRRE